MNVEDAPFRVINGINTQSSPLIIVTPTTDRIPGRLGNSTIRWGGGFVTHLGQELGQARSEAFREQPSITRAQKGCHTFSCDV